MSISKAPYPTYLAIATLDRYIRSFLRSTNLGCSNSRPNRIVFIVYSRSYNFDDAISRVRNGYEKYVGTTCRRVGREGRRSPLPEGKDFLEDEAQSLSERGRDFI